jgi:hypothetical protein
MIKIIRVHLCNASMISVDHPDVKIQPPVWHGYEYSIYVFGNGIVISDGSKIKLKVDHLY